MVRKILKRWGILNKHKRVYSPLDICVYRLRAERLGVEIIKHPQPLKIMLGAVLVGVGILTLPIPCGSVFLIGLGLGLLISGGVDVWGFVKRKKNRLRFWWWRVGVMFEDLKGGIKK